jgi:hypothetical protein
MRYLPAMWLLWTLCRLKPPAAFSVASVCAMAISSFWSFESALYSIGIYAAYLVIVAMESRPISLGICLRRLVAVTMLAASLYLLVAVSYRIFLGVYPRYDVYLQLFSSEAGSKREWIAAANPAIRTWVILGFSYALAFAIGMAGVGGTEAGRPPRRHAAIGAIAAFGMLQLSYYAGRATDAVLTFLAFPLIMLFVLTVDGVIREISQRKRPAGWVNWFYAGLFCCVLAAAGGMVGDRFFRGSYVMRSNGVILRDLFSGGRDLGAAMAKIRGKLRQPAGFLSADGQGPANDDFGNWQVIPSAPTTEDIAAYLMVKKWLGSEREIFLFTPDSATVLFALKMRNALGLTHPMVDDRSAILRARALRVAKRITAGTIIIVGYMPPDSIEAEVYAYLQTKWRLQEIDHAGGTLAVLRVEAPPGER